MNDIGLPQRNGVLLYVTDNPQVTLLKRVYRRHTLSSNETVLYNSISSEKSNFSITPDLRHTVLYDISLYLDDEEDHHQIKSVSMYLKRGEQRDLLHHYNGMFLRDINIMKKNPMNVIDLPYNRLNLIGVLINAFGYSLDIDVEWYSHQNPVQVAVTYIMTHDRQEQRRFLQVFQETLVRQCFSKSYSIEQGHNSIMLDVNHMACPVIFFNFERADTEISGTLNTCNMDHPTVTLGRETQYKYKKFGISPGTHILDGGSNISNDFEHYQPLGHIELEDGCNIEMDVNYSGVMHITYVYMDVISYRNNSIVVQYQHTPEEIDNINNPPVLVPEANAFETAIDEPAEVPPPTPPPFDINEIEPEIFRIPHEEQTDMSMYEKLLEQYEMSCAIKRHPIEDCIIEMQPIKSGSYFYECPTCSKPTSYTAFKLWLKTSKTCPHCRIEYNKYPQLYTKPYSIVDLPILLWQYIRLVFFG